jgi:hypothetical protein
MASGAKGRRIFGRLRQGNSLTTSNLCLGDGNQVRGEDVVTVVQAYVLVISEKRSWV